MFESAYMHSCCLNHDFHRLTAINMACMQGWPLKMQRLSEMDVHLKEPITQKFTAFLGISASQDSGWGMPTSSALLFVGSSHSLLAHFPLCQLIYFPCRWLSPQNPVTRPRCTSSSSSMSTEATDHEYDRLRQKRVSPLWVFTNSVWLLVKPTTFVNRCSLANW